MSRIAAQSRRRSFIFARRLLAASIAIYPNVQRDGRPRGARNESAASILFDLAPGGVYQAGRVTPTAGALLPHRFSLTTHRTSTWILSLTVRRSTLCCTFPNLAAGRRYRPPCPSEPGLSSSHQKDDQRPSRPLMAAVRMIDEPLQDKVQRQSSHVTIPSFMRFRGRMW